jgi:DNA-binding NarL/FixJ family response regulator
VEDKKPARILIADDDEIACRVLAEVLSEEGYSVETVHGGKEAIRRVGSEFYDLLITDLKMPDLDGMGVLEQCSRIRPETPIIMITIFSSIESAVNAMKAGAVDYVSKPFNEREIKTVVRQALEKPVPKRAGWAEIESTMLPSNAFRSLSPRQQEIALWVIRGLSNRQIADRLFIAEQTVKDHLSDIFVKLSVQRRGELIAKLLEIPPAEK